MKRFLLIVALSCLFTVTCKSPVRCARDDQGVFSVAVSTAFSPSKQAEILRAEGNWNEFIGRTTIFTFQSSERSACMIEPQPFPLQKLEDGSLQHIPGVHGHGLVYLEVPSKGLPEDSPEELASFYRFALHEMGHIIGLNHTQVAGVMAPVPSTSFTDSDREECLRVRICQN